MNLSITLIIVIATSIISIAAFSNQNLLNNLLFWPYRMWREKQWYRLASCGFIHADVGHLIFNMFALFSFGTFVERAFAEIFGEMGPTLYVVMYFGAVITADTYNLFRHRDDPSYRSLGASGGVAAIIFASILLQPTSGIYLFFIPIAIPAYIFGPLYLVYCIYMSNRGMDNIGHLAHFTGSVFGFFFPLIFAPHLFMAFIYQLSGQ